MLTWPFFTSISRKSTYRRMERHNVRETSHRRDISEGERKGKGKRKINGEKIDILQVIMQGARSNTA